MAIRRTTPLPLPPEEFTRIKATLAPDYGSQLWQGDGQRYLLVRVPHEEPDIVNDLEEAAERVHLGDAEDAQACFLVGNRSTISIPLETLRSLIRQRIAFDRKQAATLRQRMADPRSHTFYQAPDDPRRRLRFAVRIPQEHVTDMDDGDLAELADRVGPDLETPRYRDVHAVHLVAAIDDARIDPDAFAQDLLPRFHDETYRRKQAAQQKRQREAEQRIQDAERRQVLQELERRQARARELSRGIGTTAVVPLRRPDALEEVDAGNIEAKPSRTASRTGPSDADLAALPHSSEFDSDSSSHSTSLSGPGSKPSAELPSRAPPGKPAAWRELAAHLEKQGYDILWEPPEETPGIDMAAERPDDDPQRIIIHFPGNLNLATAEQLLTAARTVQADLALCIAPEADPDAQRRIVATKVKWITPDDVPLLRF